jgi:ParB family chromosome partitioning protein
MEKNTMPGSPNLITPELVPVKRIFPSPANNRTNKTAEIESLAKSIRAQGLLQPPTVRPRPGHPGEYELVCGERRWLACRTIWDNMPVVVRDLSDDEAHEITVCENMQREDLSPMEEAAGIRTLMESGRDIATIADKLGKPVTWVARRAKLCDLSEQWIQAAQNEDSIISRWGATHLELIARFDQGVQDELLERFDNSYSDFSVNEIERTLGEYMMNLSSASWKLNDETLIPEAGSCDACQKRSGCQPNLFEQEEHKGKYIDRCLDRTCWKKKAAAFIQQKAEALKERNGDLVMLDNSNYSDSAIPRDHDLKKKCVRSYEVQPCKKTDKGAQQALVIDGPGAGSIKWVRSFNEDNPIKSPGENKKTLAEKREQLARRRRIKYVEAVIGRMQSTDSVKDDEIEKIGRENILNAANVFGAVGKPGAGWKDLEKSKHKGDALFKFVLIGVFGEWIKLLEHPEYGDAIVNEKFADRVCKFLDWDANFMKMKIEDETPEPKAWASQEAAEPAAPAIEQKKSKKSAVRACRVCGCTETTPCIDEVGDTCSWAERDLCSACVGKEGGDRYEYNGETVFVSPGIGGKEFGTFKKTKSGAGIKRIVSKDLPMVSSREEAQRMLDAFAEKHGLGIAGHSGNDE